MHVVAKSNKLFYYSRRSVCFISKIPTLEFIEFGMRDLCYQSIEFHYILIDHLRICKM